MIKTTSQIRKKRDIVSIHMTKTLFKKYLLFTLLASTSVVFSACTKPAILQTQTESPSPAIVSPESSAPNAKLQANYAFTAEEDGVTALDVLSSHTTVETKDYGNAGTFVTKINQLEGNSEYYWAFYVNDKYAEKGASQTILQKGDTIKFVYEAVTLSQ
jgi:hypothetical protein